MAVVSVSNGSQRSACRVLDLLNSSTNPLRAHAFNALHHIAICIAHKLSWWSHAIDGIGIVVDHHHECGSWGCWCRTCTWCRSRSLRWRHWCPHRPHPWESSCQLENDPRQPLDQNLE